MFSGTYFTTYIKTKVFPICQVCLKKQIMIPAVALSVQQIVPQIAVTIFQMWIQVLNLAHILSGDYVFDKPHQPLKKSKMAVIVSSKIKVFRVFYRNLTFVRENVLLEK